MGRRRPDVVLQVVAGPVERQRICVTVPKSRVEKCHPEAKGREVVSSGGGMEEGRIG
jgi:hypothetical protein